MVLVLCDALSVDDLHDNRYPHLYELAETGAVGLMNTAVAGPRTPTAAVLTLALGQQQPAMPSDEWAYDLRETLAQETGLAAEIYGRRTGLAVGADRQIVHLGIGSLTRRGLNALTLGTALAAATPPRRAVVCGNADTDRPGRRAALLAMDSVGTAAGDVALMQADPTVLPGGHADASVETLSRYAAEAHADLFVLQLGDTARLKAAQKRLTPQAYPQARVRALQRLDLFLYLLRTRLAEGAPPTDVVLLAPYPPSDAEYHLPGWGQLAPVLAFGPDFPPGLLTSPTTRTAGLIANVDVAPTVLRLLGCAVPITMTGRAFRSMPTTQDGAHRLAELARKDFVAILDAQATTQVSVGIGLLCFIGLVCGMIARRRRGPGAARPFAPVLVFTASLPTAYLLAPILVPPTLFEYGLRIAAWMAVLTALSYLLARPLRLSPPVVSALLGLGLLLADLCTGQNLMKESPISANALSGVRYYGMGNEYLGATLAMALSGGFCWLDDRIAGRSSSRSSGLDEAGRAVFLTAERRDRAILVGFWIVLTLLLGWPGLGANSGSLVVTVAGFGACTAILRGRRPTWRLWAGCVAAGLLLSFAFSGLDALLAREEGSHAGVVLRAATHGRGAGYLREIVQRKLLMNLQLLLYPYLLLAAAGIAATVVAARALIGDAVQEALRRRVWLTRSLPALPPTMAATLLFKDSGFVTLAYFLGGACLLILWYAFTE